MECVENKRMFFFTRFTTMSISECLAAHSFGRGATNTPLVNVKWVALSVGGR